VLTRRQRTLLCHWSNYVVDDNTVKRDHHYHQAAAAAAVTLQRLLNFIHCMLHAALDSRVHYMELLQYACLWRDHVVRRFHSDVQISSQQYYYIILYACLGYSSDG